MKRLLFLCLFISLITTAAFSQTQDHSTTVDVDTINVTGYVVDEFGKPFANVKVSADYVNARTPKNGFFELNGIRNKSHISFVSDSLSDVLFNNNSRFIIYTLIKPSTKLTAYDNKIIIEAKREKSRHQISIKEEVLLNVGFPNYGNNAQYPGGIGNFYKYIKANLTYPSKAIKNNIEGTVGIEFDVTKIGTLDNFKIIKDIGYGTSKALIEVLKNSKKWQPSITFGKPNIFKYYIEIPFKLID